jgi:O-antigen/teichoic acid export membrane protein
MCTLIGSELVVFLYLVNMFFLQFRQLKRNPYEKMGVKEVRTSLMAVSIPTTGLRIFHAITNAVQPFLIKAALVQSGLSEVGATEEFGLLAGVAMTIGFFPAFIAHSFLIVLIPTVSKAYSEGDFPKLQKLLQTVMLLTFFYGTIAVIVFYIFAEPLTDLFFHSISAAWYLQMLWPYFLFHFFVIPMQAYLIGLGLVKDAFIHSVWSTTFSFILIYVLGSLHQFQMGGIIIGMNGGIVLLTLMHYLTICKKIGVTFILKDYAKITFYK